MLYDRIEYFFSRLAGAGAPTLELDVIHSLVSRSQVFCTNFGGLQAEAFTFRRPGQNSKAF